MQTLPVNLFRARKHKHIEFVVLNYNSDDDIDNFIQECMSDYIEKGILAYYKTSDPACFHRSHSRNMAFKLSGGDLLCNLDADNFIGDSFVTEIRKQFDRDINIFLATTSNKRKSSDVFGRICFKRTDFLALRGFDERMDCYGFEDLDFIDRLKRLKLDTVQIHSRNLDALTHQTTDRISNEFMARNFQALYLRYLTPSSTDILFLLKNGRFKRGTIIDNESHLKENMVQYQFSISENNWMTGNWRREGSWLGLADDTGNMESFLYNESDHYLSSGQGLFIKMDRPDLIEQAILFYSELSNRGVMKINQAEERIAVNDQGYGQGCVYKNFDYANPLYI